MGRVMRMSKSTLRKEDEQDKEVKQDAKGDGG